ncbi:MAG: exonuclease subunit SbcD [Acidimicrobiia bacterium]|nr:exonuclease subunit SbcD [Acidimicrobiia bacterium]
MRILHTADWHVGKPLRGRSRLDEHEAVLDELVEVADAEAVDLVIVAGDLFDAASPPAEAEQVVYRALLGLAGRHRHVVVVAGNHDNPRRLAALQALFALARVHIAVGVARPDEGGVLELDVGGQTARVALLPWLSQRYVVTAADLLAHDAAEHQQQYAGRVRTIVEALCAGASPNAVNLVVGHLFALGATLGGGERHAHTVLDYAVPSQVIPTAVQYAALGHLHRRQRIDGPSPTWYPGSPLQLDFGETADTKGALLVEVAPGRPAKVTEVTLLAGRRLRTLRGTMAELGALAGTTGTDWLRVVVDEPARVGLADEVRDLFAHVVEVSVAAGEAAGAVGPASEGRLARSPVELFGEYLAGRRVEDPRLEVAFADLLEAAQAEGTAEDEAGVAGDAA